MSVTLDAIAIVKGGNGRTVFSDSSDIKVASRNVVKGVLNWLSLYVIDSHWRRREMGCSVLNNRPFLIFHHTVKSLVSESTNSCSLRLAYL